jgi:hypothetical protein
VGGEKPWPSEEDTAQLLGNTRRQAWSMDESRPRGLATLRQSGLQKLEDHSAVALLVQAGGLL